MPSKVQRSPMRPVLVMYNRLLTHRGSQLNPDLASAPARQLQRLRNLLLQHPVLLLFLPALLLVGIIPLCKTYRCESPPSPVTDSSEKKSRFTPLTQTTSTSVLLSPRDQSIRVEGPGA
ncbi:unnamed protein product [Parnassius apollo]|uniref:(apollo) hypothetical protein n=1 Tax=Parnassius apollo TaxID=110799 RepID=A0A8S3W2M3_PARAO|nr:unnamed protein product [Parnassius apollo]